MWSSKPSTSRAAQAAIEGAPWSIGRAIAGAARAAPRAATATAAKAPRSASAAATIIGRTEPVGERRRRSDATVGAEHGARERDAEDRAEPLQHAVRPGGRSHLRRIDRAEHGHGHGGDRHRDADSGDEERDDEDDVARVKRCRERDPREPGSEQREPRDDHRAQPETAREASGERRDDHRRAEERQQAQPGLQRRVAQPELEVLRRQERARGDRGHREECRAVARSERRDPQEPQRQHRMRHAPLPDDEGSERGDPQRKGRDDLRTCPAGVVRTYEAPDDPDQCDRDQGDTAEVERHTRPERLRQETHRQDAGSDADRDVDPEDPVPVESLGDRPADDRAECDRETCEPAVDAEDGSPALGRVRLGQDREAERQDDRPAESLERPRADQEPGGRGDGAGGGCDREQREPEHEEASPSIAITERRCADDARGDGDVVRVDRPLEAGEADMQRLLDPRERRADHERVEAGHEERCGRQDEHPSQAGPAWVVADLGPDRRRCERVVHGVLHSVHAGVGRPGLPWGRTAGRETDTRRARAYPCVIVLLRGAAVDGLPRMTTLS